MNPGFIIAKLFSDFNKYYPSSQMSRWSIIKTLLTFTYYKSGFSRKKGQEIFYKTGGFKVYAYDYPSLIKLYSEIFMQRIYQFNADTDRPFIIDCGANIGMSVLFFKQCYPKSEIWAFEPNANSFALLEKNIKENNIEGVQLFNYAISDADEWIDFYVPQEKGSLNGSSIHGYNDGNKITIEAKKLSGLVQNKKIDCIKIDIEGDEEKVIQDLTINSILKDVDNLVIEYHHQMNDSISGLSNFLSYFERATYDTQLRLHEDAGGIAQNFVFYFKKRRSSHTTS